MRDLVEAAASRTILELKVPTSEGALDGKGAQQDLGKLGDDAGGHNLLAQSPRSGTHLSRRLSPSCPAPGRCGNSVLLLGFPRFIEDGNYLFERVRSILPETVTLQQALVAHQRTAQSDKVRVRRRTQIPEHTCQDLFCGARRAELSDHDQVDRIALGREITRYQPGACQARGGARRFSAF